jgi:quercetin 2,3-dioxygenase
MSSAMAMPNSRIERNWLGVKTSPMPEVTSVALLDLIASRDGRDGTVLVHQYANIYRAVVRDGAELKVPLTPGRYAWVQVVRGEAIVNTLIYIMDAGHGAAVSAETELVLAGRPCAELLVFDLA